MRLGGPLELLEFCPHDLERSGESGSEYEGFVELS
jgi:hypothetical protein